MVLNKDLRSIELAQFTNDFIVTAKISSHHEKSAITVVSAYFKYNMPTTSFTENLHQILATETRALIGAFQMWFCPTRNDRGRIVEELIEDHGLRVQNVPSPLKTYEREGMGASNIDVTLTTPSIAQLVCKWTVLDITDSDHNVLTLRNEPRTPASGYSYNTRMANWTKFVQQLETIMIQNLVRETSLNDFNMQHGFVPGKSTITAINELYRWTDDSRCRHVFLVFLDITGAFDNVGWFPVLKRLEHMGASICTTRLIQSYLQNRRVNLTLEGNTYSNELERGCPQGSQLGPTLWKVAMTDIGDISRDNNTEVIIYADDIAMLAGAARPPTAFSRAETYLDSMIIWAKNYGLNFSPEKTSCSLSKVA